MIHAIGNVSEQRVQGMSLDMKHKSIGVMIFVGVFLSALVAMAIATQDKYTLRIAKWARIL